MAIINIPSPKLSVNPISTSGVPSGTSKGMSTTTKVVILVAVSIGLYFGYVKIVKPMLDQRKADKLKAQKTDEI